MVASDIFGVSSRAMMAALIAGERNHGARATGPLQDARQDQCDGRGVTEHRAFLLAKMLARIDAGITELDTKIGEMIALSAAAGRRRLRGAGPARLDERSPASARWPPRS